jgi:hypothetical protein
MYDVLMQRQSKTKMMMMMTIFMIKIVSATTAVVK